MEGNAFDAWAAARGDPETEIGAAAGVSQPVVNKARRGLVISIASAARLARATRGAVRPDQFVLSPEDAQALRFLRGYYARRPGASRRRAGRR